MSRTIEIAIPAELVHLRNLIISLANPEFAMGFLDTLAMSNGFSEMEIDYLMEVVNILHGNTIPIRKK